MSKILLFSFKLECEIIKNIWFFGFSVIAVYCCSWVYYKIFLLSLKRKLTMILKHMSLFWDFAWDLQPTTKARGCLIPLMEFTKAKLWL